MKFPPIEFITEWQLVNAALVGSDLVCIVCDENTKKYCLPVLSNVLQCKNVVISIDAGDDNKVIANAEKIWNLLQEHHSGRNTTIIALGGGMICDLAGFAASVFARGIQLILIPTSLLAMCDAAIGSKTAVNFNGIKNAIGTFYRASGIFIYTPFLNTLPLRECRAGYAEMIKHGAIADIKHFNDLCTQDIEAIRSWETLLKHSISIKSRIVEMDPKENGMRKLLNFGHTAGHALESYFMNSSTPLLHGEAVLYGMLVALYISAEMENENKVLLNVLENFVYTTCSMPLLHFDIEKVYDIMLHDKKNKDAQIRMVLLSKNHKAEYDLGIPKSTIYKALQIIHE